MKLVVHQPQYLPWLGYFHKVALGERFVILDHVQYSRNKLQNRNVIRGQHGPVRLTVPVVTSGHFGDAIAEVLVDSTQPWARKHWGSIRQTYGAYPYFGEYAPELEAVYSRRWDRLAELNIHLMGLLMGWLGIEVERTRSSELAVDGHKTELLINLCRAVGADTYISGRGAEDYLEPESFKAAGIRLLWSEFRHPPYRQCEEPFMPELSALDVLMNLGPDSKNLLQEARQLSTVVDATDGSQA